MLLYVFVSPNSPSRDPLPLPTKGPQQYNQRRIFFHISSRLLGGPTTTRTRFHFSVLSSSPTLGVRHTLGVDLLEGTGTDKRNNMRKPSLVNTGWVCRQERKETLLSRSTKCSVKTTERTSVHTRTMIHNRSLSIHLYNTPRRPVRRTSLHPVEPP